jgi:hypothetical protein
MSNSETSLDEFIAQTIDLIYNGVRQARKKYGNHVAPDPEPEIADTEGAEFVVNRQAIQSIDFDVAVTVATSRDTNKGAGILIAAVGAGANSKNSHANSATSRIRFTIPLRFPAELR